MSDLSIERAREHFEVLERARAGALTGAERAALVVLLDRLLVATLLEEDDDVVGRIEGRTRSWRHVAAAYRALVAVEAEPCPPLPARGADVRRLPRAR